MSQVIPSGSSSCYMPSSHSSSPLVSSGVASLPLSLSQGRGQLSDGDTSAEDENECPICSKKFKNAGGLRRHRIVHIQEDSMTQDHKEELLNKSIEVAEQKLQEMLQDPVIDGFGKEKLMYIQRLLEKLVVADENWVALNKFIVDHITVIFCKRSRALPMRQYEEHLSMFIKWLGENMVNDVLPSLLSVVVEGSTDIIRNVLYRYATKMFESLAAFQVSLFVKTKSNDSSNKIDFSFSQKQSLYYAAGYIARKIKRVNCSNDTRGRRVRCIEERMCFNSEVEYSEDFYKFKDWFDCLDRGGLVAVNENFFLCVVKVEEIIQSCFASCPSGVNKRLLLNELYKLENSFVLDLWYIMTQGILEEREALAFFEVFVTHYLKFSGTAEVELRKRDVEAEKGLQTVALRTDMKRNRPRD